MICFNVWFVLRWRRIVYQVRDLLAAVGWFSNYTYIASLAILTLILYFGAPVGSFQSSKTLRQDSFLPLAHKLLPYSVGVPVQI